MFGLGVSDGRTSTFRFRSLSFPSNDWEDGLAVKEMAQFVRERNLGSNLINGDYLKVATNLN